LDVTDILFCQHEQLLCLQLSANWFVTRLSKRQARMQHYTVSNKLGLELARRFITTTCPKLFGSVICFSAFAQQPLPATWGGYAIFYLSTQLGIQSRLLSVEWCEISLLYSTVASTICKTLFQCWIQRQPLSCAISISPVPSDLEYLLEQNQETQNYWHLV